MSWSFVDGGIKWIGHDGPGFAFDNEIPRHRVFCAPFQLASRMVTNEEFFAFMSDGGYQRPELWLSDGWNVVQPQEWESPLYWENVDEHLVDEHAGRFPPRDRVGAGLPRELL